MGLLALKTASGRACWRSRQRQRRVLLALKPGAQNGPGAQTASAWSSWRSRRASWRPRRPPDGPPGAPGAKDGLRTVLLALTALGARLLAPKTASGQASWRPRRLLDGPARCPAQSRPSTPELPDLHDNSLDETSVTSAADELSCMSTCFVALCDSLVPQTASGGVSWCQASFRRLCLPVG